MEDLGLNLAPRLKIEKVEPPSEREGGVIVADVDELLSKLRDEAKVLWDVWEELRMKWKEVVGKRITRLIKGIKMVSI